MSWTQGLVEREQLPEVVIRFFENKFVDFFGEHQDLECLSWFEGENEFRALFKKYEHSIDVKISIDEFLSHLRKAVDEQAKRRTPEHPDLQGGRTAS